MVPNPVENTENWLTSYWEPALVENITFFSFLLESFVVITLEGVESFT